MRVFFRPLRESLRIFATTETGTYVSVHVLLLQRQSLAGFGDICGQGFFIIINQIISNGNKQ
jgi:hypothetical protein